MNNSDSKLLAVLVQKLDDHMKNYAQDREGAVRRYAEEREERRIWREEIDVKVENLAAKIEPIHRDHELVSRAGKWLVVIAGGIATVVKSWFIIRDHMKP